jgi:hypothetical protein
MEKSVDKTARQMSLENSTILLKNLSRYVATWLIGPYDIFYTCGSSNNIYTPDTSIQY